MPDEIKIQVSAPGAKESAEEVDKVVEAVEETGDAAEKATPKIDDAAESVVDAGDAAGDAAPKIDDAAEAIDKAGESSEKASPAIDDAGKALDKAGEKAVGAGGRVGGLSNILRQTGGALRMAGGGVASFGRILTGLAGGPMGIAITACFALVGIVKKLATAWQEAREQTERILAPTEAATAAFEKVKAANKNVVDTLMGASTAYDEYIAKARASEQQTNANIDAETRLGDLQRQLATERINHAEASGEMTEQEAADARAKLAADSIDAQVEAARAKVASESQRLQEEANAALAALKEAQAQLEAAKTQRSDERAMANDARRRAIRSDERSRLEMPFSAARRSLKETADAEKAEQEKHEKAALDISADLPKLEKKIEQLRIQAEKAAEALQVGVDASFKSFLQFEKEANVRKDIAKQQEATANINREKAETKKAEQEQKKRERDAKNAYDKGANDLAKRSENIVGQIESFVAGAGDAGRGHELGRRLLDLAERLKEGRKDAGEVAAVASMLDALQSAYAMSAENKALYQRMQAESAKLNRDFQTLRNQFINTSKGG